MTVLFINIQIENKNKLELLKITFKDICEIFKESHVYVRGKYAAETLEYIKQNFKGQLHLYQDLNDGDWIESSLKMLSKINARSVYLYFEDHRLVDSVEKLNRTIEIFDEELLDYLCYTAFKATRLSRNNLLPINTTVKENLNIFENSKEIANLIGKISPNYYVFSIMSITSLEYLKSILFNSNSKYKIYSPKISSLIRIFNKYPNCRRFINSINKILKKINVRYCLYSPSSPFNLEKMWFEFEEISNTNRRYAIANAELLANFDDDNGAHGESLVKRGLYPFHDAPLEISKLNSINRLMYLKKEEKFDATYFSQIDRINYPPVIQVRCNKGKVKVKTPKSVITLIKGEMKSYYSNIGVEIVGIEDSELSLTIYDECF